MNPESEIKRLLQEELWGTRMKNPAYSLRAFARRLQLAPSALSEMLSGKRPITPRVGKRILEKLLVEPTRSQEILSAFVARAERKRAALAQGIQTPIQDYHLLRADTYAAIAEWYHFAILSLAETTGFQSTSSWIAQRLGVPEATAAQAIERLVRLGMLERLPSGELKATGASFESTRDVADAGIARSHRETLDLARRSLDEDSLEQRDFSAITMAVDPSLLPKAKQMIENFRRVLCEFLESGSKREVYRMSVQLFPLTRVPVGAGQDSAQTDTNPGFH